MGGMPREMEAYKALGGVWKVSVGTPVPTDTQQFPKCLRNNQRLKKHVVIKKKNKIYIYIYIYIYYKSSKFEDRGLCGDARPHRPHVGPLRRAMWGRASPQTSFWTPQKGPVGTRVPTDPILDPSEGPCGDARPHRPHFGPLRRALWGRASPQTPLGTPLGPLLIFF